MDGSINGIQFAEQPRNRGSITFRKMRFDLICEATGIEHRLTKPNHPWTNGQVERMNRTIKDATVKRYHYDSHNQLRRHFADFLDAYNSARRLKTLSGLTPYSYICKISTSEPERFILIPIHQMPGLNTKVAVESDPSHVCFAEPSIYTAHFCTRVASRHGGVLPSGGQSRQLPDCRSPDLTRCIAPPLSRTSDAKVHSLGNATACRRMQRLDIRRRRGVLPG